MDLVPGGLPVLWLLPAVNAWNCSDDRATRMVVVGQFTALRSRMRSSLCRQARSFGVSRW